MLMKENREYPFCSFDVIKHNLFSRTFKRNGPIGRLPSVSLSVIVTLTLSHSHYLSLSLSLSPSLSLSFSLFFSHSFALSLSHTHITLSLHFPEAAVIAISINAALVDPHGI